MRRYTVTDRGSRWRLILGVKGSRAWGVAHLSIFRALAMSFAILLIATACATDSDTQNNTAAADNQTEDASVDPYYEGASIELMVPTAAGGGADAIAQFMAPWLSDFIEGNPQVVVTHHPGAGGVAGGNKFEYSRDHDGMTLLMGTLATATNWLVGEPDVRYDFLDWERIISTSHSGLLYISTDTGVESPSDLLDTDAEIVKGGRAPTGPIWYELAIEVLGIGESIREVWGYEGGGALRLAFEQGEINMNGITRSNFLTGDAYLFEEGLAEPFIQIGIPDGRGGLEADPALPEDLPTVVDAHVELYGAEPSGEAFEALVTLVETLNLAAAIQTHSDAPPEAVEALREATAALVEDPEFLENLEDTLGDPSIVAGQELDDAFDDLAQMDESHLNYIRTWLAETYPAEVGDISPN